jgi:hypothetical protein
MTKIRREVYENIYNYIIFSTTYILLVYVGSYLSRQEVENCIIKFSFRKNLRSA